MPPTGAGTYPTTTMAGDSYQKMPVSGSPHYTAEPHDMSLQQATMPSVQLSLVGNDPQQSGIRTQYASYVQGSSAPAPQLSMPTASDNGLSVPRYVDNNPRPSKSPRHATHDSVHSGASLATSNETPGEYRYGPTPYMGVGGSSDLNAQQHPHTAQHSPAQAPHQQARSQHSRPQSQQHSPVQPLPLPHPQQQQQQQQSQPHQQPQGAGQLQTPTPYGAPSHDAVSNTSSNPPSATSAVHPPPRDYFPPSAPWTATASDSNQPPYANGESRQYSFPDQYKAGHNVKGDALPQPHAYGPPRGSFDATTMNHYSWSAA